MKFLLYIFLLEVLFLSFSGAETVQDKYTTASVLSTGRWFRMAITENGIYRIDYSQLRQLGIANPSNPRIFGNNTGQLSFYNDGTGADDLKEIAVYKVTGGDNIFNEGDYLLFYGMGTHRWIFKGGEYGYEFIRHHYSDTAYYFITSDSEEGMNVGPAIQPGVPANYFSSVSDALFIHEIESENLIKSGRNWYQPVTYLKDTEINPLFRNLVTSETLKFNYRVLARSGSATSFRLYSGETVLSEAQVQGVNMTSTTGTYAQIASGTGETLPVSQSPVFTVRFLNNGDASAKAWIDYVKLEARQENIYEGTTVHFSDSRSVGPGFVTEFTFKSISGGITIWEVSDPSSPKIIRYTKTDDKIKFILTTDSLRSFIVFKAENVKKPLLKPLQVPNQDLHSTVAADMVIVVHPTFRAYASRLAEIHSNNSGLSSLIVTPDEIYNEFSGGIPDIVAIRNFLRMKYLRQKESEHPLKYLLLFGDGSYENKSPPPGNPNYVPTWQSGNSNIYISSFASDDFFGLLEDGEGEETGTEDLGIGRLPVSDTVEAGIIVSKISSYLDPSNNGNWKNVVTLIADDEDGNTHISDAEGLAELLADSVPWINVDKIYFDAYEQVTTSTGQFYPEVRKAISDRINSGTLIFNYIGHGNENSLAHERVITTEDILSWTNQTRNPLFVTATCEFSRFDDIDINFVTREITERSSAGEKILLKKEGGAIALMSTTRLVYSAPNYQLNRNIFDVAFDGEPNGMALRMGDIIRKAKNLSGSGINKRNFILLGDPAVRLSYAWHGNIVTDSLNGISVTQPLDTLKALSMVTISGHLEDPLGFAMNKFDGTLTSVVYDKPASIETRGNDGGQKIMFTLQNNIIQSGQTIVRDGKFTFTFMVPRDIDYTYGQGKISYYGADAQFDLKGSFHNLITGGFSNFPGVDTSGPVIRLYFNDTLFRNGGITGPDPRLLAVLEDNGGINITGKGLGHDITCWLDEDRTDYIVLNNYFENYLGDAFKGRIVYNFSGLTPGEHSLTVKAWDNLNNSSTRSIRFSVEPGEALILKNLMNYPNPFSNLTEITLEHNRSFSLFDIVIRVYSLDGKIVRMIETSEFSTGYRLLPIVWDGTDSGGSKVDKGIYPYTVRISTPTGETATISGRMIIY